MPSKDLYNVLVETSKYKVRGTLWIECNGQRYFGPGPAELLQHISTTGSIRQAAIQMGMSYKKAWHIVNMLNENTASPMVIPQTGGTKGGGSVVTEEARKMIEWHGQLRERFAKFLESESIDM
ncbi:MAG: ModE family transcriptional regulator [Flavitalea sp.]